MLPYANPLQIYIMLHINEDTPTNVKRYDNAFIMLFNCLSISGLITYSRSTEDITDGVDNNYIASLYSKVMIVHTQYAHDVVLTFVRRRFNVMDVVWMSKRRRVLTGYALLEVGLKFSCGPTMVNP